MTAKQRYTLAYRIYRATKGNGCTLDCPANVKAWQTYTLNFFGRDKYMNKVEDPITLTYTDKYHVHKAYHFASDYRYSKVGRS